MNRQGVTKLMLILSLFASLLFQLLGLTGQIGRTSRELFSCYDCYFGPFLFTVYGWIVLDALLITYTLYSLNIIARRKSEFARQFIAIADVGLILTSILQVCRTIFRHSGSPLAAMLFGLGTLFVLFRVVTGYRGNPTRPYWGKAPFDMYLGWMLFCCVNDIAQTVISINGTHLFSTSLWAVILVLLTTMEGLVFGLKLLSPMCLFTILACLGAVAAHHLSPEGLDGRYPAVYVTAILCMAVTLAAMIVSAIKRRRLFWR